MSVSIERAYDYRNREKRRSEYVVLVDRLWPRGIRKADLAFDEWLKEIAPSTELRKWFDHDPRKWAAFRSKYAEELEEHTGSLDALRERADQGHLTLLYSARDEKHNQAVVLRDVLAGTTE